MRRLADELAFIGYPYSDDDLVMAILNIPAWSTIPFSFQSPPLADTLPSPSLTSTATFSVTSLECKVRYLLTMVLSLLQTISLLLLLDLGQTNRTIPIPTIRPDPLTITNPEPPTTHTSLDQLKTTSTYLLTRLVFNPIRQDQITPKMLLSSNTTNRTRYLKLHSMVLNRITNPIRSPNAEFGMLQRNVTFDMKPIPITKAGHPPIFKPMLPISLPLPPLPPIGCSTRVPPIMSPMT